MTRPRNGARGSRVVGRVAHLERGSVRASRRVRRRPVLFPAGGHHAEGLRDAPRRPGGPGDGFFPIVAEQRRGVARRVRGARRSRSSSAATRDERLPRRRRGRAPRARRALPHARAHPRDGSARCERGERRALETVTSLSAGRVVVLFVFCLTGFLCGTQQDKPSFHELMLYTCAPFFMTNCSCESVGP